MPDFVFCPTVDDEGWVSHPVTGALRDRQPPAEHIVACRSCGAKIACSNATDRAERLPICWGHLDEDWPPTVLDA